MKTKLLYMSFNAVKLFNNVIKVMFLSLIPALILSCTQKAAPPAAAPAPVLPVSTLSASTETTFSEYPAAVQGAVDVDIRPQVGGYLEKVLVNEGAYVKAGQPLFQINERPFREALNNAVAALHAAEAAVANAQLEIDKISPLVANKVVSDIQLRTARSAHRMAVANAEQARAGVATARINLGYARIKAPVSGYVGRIPKKQGSLVSPTDPEALTRLSDIHEVHVYFSLGETDFNAFNAKYPGRTFAEKLKNVPPVALKLADESEYPVKGKIDMVDGQFDKNTGSITLRASFANEAGTLRSGNTGKIRLGVNHREALLIPQSATVEMQDKMFVYALNKQNKVTKQPITVGGISGNQYLVKSGLRPGDRIVLKGFEVLKDGDAVVPEKLTTSLK
ncbi:efflux transporter periplasmic adaptor subunit [Pedobacter yulinensis]|uniref:Efflux transporter periplasmic adaptor subunit n=1 Tax=Pedobacter yulinensis TaxID=2126353 RepID=A0A2T3HJQ6_9SPHI|nr:efflux RND transporter periplasmic adaptor subunit [Pedobacter yulinensis]PST82623.1 efflux transporter periplasmic adaptor subunit [Pedobacter yulinensis]